MMSIQRKFIPGSEWLYFKIFSGPKVADKLLSKQIYSIVCSLEKNKMIKTFFFIRFFEPDFHLRIRFQITEISNIEDILSFFCNSLNKYVQQGLIDKIQIDTYNRELERYTPNYIEFSEKLFHIDSIYIIKIVKEINKISREELRWMSSLLLVDTILDVFEVETQNKCLVYKNLSNNFKKEFGFTDYNSKQFNNKYRENRSIIDNILKSTLDDEDFQMLHKHILNRKRKLQNLINHLNINMNEVHKLIPSYIHMTLNRIFQDCHRMQELVIYDFLYRHYDSSIKRSYYEQ